MRSGSLEREFHQEMLAVYKEAREEGYTASAFLNMVQAMGGLAAAKQLVMDTRPSEGFTRLWEMGRLDLSVEAHVLEPKYAELFTPQERLAAKKRLEEYRRK